MIFSRKLLLRIAGSVLIVLGVARGVGGVMLLAPGEAMPVIAATRPTVIILGFILLLIGVMLTISGFGVFRKQEIYWKLGVLMTILFVLDGLLNGFFLFGMPRLTGFLLNSAVAAVILLLLFRGHDALREYEAL